MTSWPALAPGGSGQAARARHQRPGLPPARPADVRDRRLTRAVVAAPAPVPRFDAIILAGGRGARLGGADKPGLVVGGRDDGRRGGLGRGRGRGGPGRRGRPAAARPARAGAARTSSHEQPGARVSDVREQPAGAGARAARRAARGPRPLVAVLAADRRSCGPSPAVSWAPRWWTGPRAARIHRIRPERAGVRCWPTTADRPQWLTGCWLDGRAAGRARGYAARRCAGCWVRWTRCWSAGGPRPGSRRPGWTATPRRRWRRPAGWPGTVSRPSRAGALTSTATAGLPPCAELGLDPADVPVQAVLDLARVAAHQVERPAAPLSAFMLGVAVGPGRRPGRRRGPDRASWPHGAGRRRMTSPDRPGPVSAPRSAPAGRSIGALSAAKSAPKTFRVAAAPGPGSWRKPGWTRPAGSITTTAPSPAPSARHGPARRWAVRPGQVAPARQHPGSALLT